MKRNTFLIKVISVFCVMALMAGTLSGCSLVSKIADKLNPKNLLNKVFHREEETAEPTTEATLPDSIEEIPEDTTLPTEQDTEPLPTEQEIPVTTLPEETEPTTEDLIDAKPPQRTQWTGETTASVLNVREYPGTDYEIVRGLERGSRVVIYEQTTINGEVWGKVSDGWVYMKYVALDDVIEGSWYELVEITDDVYVYQIWNFHSDNTFVYTECSLKASEDFAISRTLAQGGGQYRFDGEQLWLELTHGDRVAFCGYYINLNGYTTVDADIYGASMIWDGYYSELTRGALENIQKQLRNP